MHSGTGLFVMLLLVFKTVQAFADFNGMLCGSQQYPSCPPMSYCEKNVCRSCVGICQESSLLCKTLCWHYFTDRSNAFDTSITPTDADKHITELPTLCAWYEYLSGGRCLPCDDVCYKDSNFNYSICSKHCPKTAQIIICSKLNIDLNDCLDTSQREENTFVYDLRQLDRPPEKSFQELVTYCVLGLFIVILSVIACAAGILCWRYKKKPSRNRRRYLTSKDEFAEQSVSRSTTAMTSQDDTYINAENNPLLAKPNAARHTDLSQRPPLPEKTFQSQFSSMPPQLSTLPDSAVNARIPVTVRDQGSGVAESLLTDLGQLTREENSSSGPQSEPSYVGETSNSTEESQARSSTVYNMFIRHPESSTISGTHYPEPSEPLKTQSITRESFPVNKKRAADCRPL